MALRLPPTRRLAARVECKHVIKSVYEFLICINLFSKAHGGGRWFKARDSVLTVSRVIVAVYLVQSLFVWGVCWRKGEGNLIANPRTCGINERVKESGQARLWDKRIQHA